MANPGLLETITRSWKQDPEHYAQGQTTGLSAALWSNSQNSTIEVNAHPVADQNIVCLKLASFSADYWRDGKATYSGPSTVGDVSIVTAGSQPRAVMRGKFSCLHFYVPNDFLKDTLIKEGLSLSAQNLEIVDPKRIYDPIIERIGRDIICEMRSDLPLSRLRMDALGLDLAIQIIRKYSAESMTKILPGELAKGGLSPRKMRRCVDMLTADLSQEHSLSTLAAEVGLSPFHFARSFKLSVGAPPHAYLTQLRMQKAKSLLSDTEMSVTDIAFEIGYESSQALSRAFRKMFHCSPMQFRRDRSA